VNLYFFVLFFKVFTDEEAPFAEEIIDPRVLVDLQAKQPARNSSTFQGNISTILAIFIVKNHFELFPPKMIKGSIVDAIHSLRR